MANAGGDILRGHYTHYYLIFKKKCFFFKKFKISISLQQYFKIKSVSYIMIDNFILNIVICFFVKID